MSTQDKQHRRAIRRLAMQALYQLDVTLGKEPGDPPAADALADTLDDEHDAAEARSEAAHIALNAWAQHAAYDELATQLAPDWPTHRQPPVDRAILRLACYEIATGSTPPKVAINEAIELAKQFAAENSPAFINGVLDKAVKRLAPTDNDAPPTPSPTGDAWLDDAVSENRE